MWVGEKYNILKMFHKNEMQDVFIGCHKNNSQYLVLINYIRDESCVKLLENLDMKEILDNILYSNKEEDQIVMVTEFKEGYRLEEYFSNKYLRLGTRMHMILEYLDKISKYDRLNELIRNSLILKSQVLVKNEKLSINEFIFIDENVEFKDVIGKIQDYIRKILFTGLNMNEYEVRTISEIESYINNLGTEYEKYDRIQEIFDHFKKFYLYKWALK
ncbi:hypothetical protein [Anaeromicrobium sediminis]|uniref:Protein kinase domain-containing protein n=1 Tax=Anaeromicrobium sediminis TaxID=1478221 RepID=A0A267ML70_9FIRM|nr:hypothetical protein [Anaeromicrobium sediminis]PAB60167.1 hypothetical protein CCE28_07295 [Anaeromicrobium sediminis]